MSYGKYTLVDGKAKKPPFDPRTGQLASPTNPATWSSLAEAQQALTSERYNGIGFVFAPDDPFTGTDVDNCLNPDGSMQQWAQEIVTTLNSYTELSPSGTGVHILTRATLPHGRKIGNIEMYSEGRYFTMTAHHLAGTPHTIKDRQEEQTALYHAYEPVSHKKREHRVYEMTRDDDAVLHKAIDEKQDIVFLRLFTGDTAGFPSKSNADFTFVLKLLYWCNGDVQQVRRLFLRSSLVDEKTLSRRGDSTYLDVTIANAVKKRRRGL